MLGLKDVEEVIQEIGKRDAKIREQKKLLLESRRKLEEATESLTSIRDRFLHREATRMVIGYGLDDVIAELNSILVLLKVGSEGEKETV